MDDNQPSPTDDMPLLMQAAIATHEMFLHYLAAGFTEDQALKLIAHTIRPHPPTTQ